MKKKEYLCVSHETATGCAVIEIPKAKSVICKTNNKCKFLKKVNKKVEKNQPQEADKAYWPSEEITTSCTKWLWLIKEKKHEGHAFGKEINKFRTLAMHAWDNRSFGHHE